MTPELFVNGFVLLVVFLAGYGLARVGNEIRETESYFDGVEAGLAQADAECPFAGDYHTGLAG
jgi:hypothetical protein